MTKWELYLNLNVISNMKVIPKGWTSGIWFEKRSSPMSMLPQNFADIDWVWFEENILEKIKRK